MVNVASVAVKEPLETSFSSAPTEGLTSQEAVRRLSETGPNKLPEVQLPGLPTIFIRQFLSPFIYMLLVAAIVSLAFGKLASAVFILAVLLLNAGIGTVQEYSAQKSAAALRNLVHGRARVLRDGEAVTIDIEEVVPGDVVLLTSGDKVPADMQLVASDGLEIDESMLTGESVAVVKDSSARPGESANLAERADRCFAGTVVTRGRGRGVVDATAMDTEIGTIAKKVAGRRVSEAPLMIRIRRFTYQVAGAIVMAILVLAALMALRGGYTVSEMVMMAIGLAVSTIPEGLPAALTVALAIGMRRMAKENVIIRKLVAVEALGSCTFICSDKTGTLTVNELTIASAHLPSGQVYKANGAGLAPGSIDGDDLEPLRELCVTGVLANESHLDYNAGRWNGDGDIVDLAFLVFAKKAGLSLGQLRQQCPQRRLVPYESEKAFSGSINDDEDTCVFYVKGSPEKITAAATTMKVDGAVVPFDKARIEKQYEDLAANGYRVLALAKRTASSDEDDPALSELTFLGLVAMIDPIREEAKDAIGRCRDGGIGVAMVTGDHPSTAKAIAMDLGLCGPDAQPVTGSMMREAEEKGQDAVRDLVLPARVFARIEPAQKELIVATFMNDGHFVAVTGDGVNDAAAMRRANAGVAMGKSGTDVAKEAADLIITDDNFASIVAGVEQGRIVYNNIRKVIILLVATGFSALLLFFLSVLVGLPMPLTAVQLLWLNLVANGVQDVALAFEPKEGDELTRDPRRPDQPILDRFAIERILVAGTTMGALAFAVYWTALGSGIEDAQARNITLMMMVLFGNARVLSGRSETKSLFKIPYFANRPLALAVPLALGFHLLLMNVPGLRSILEIGPISPAVFAALIMVAGLFLAVEEAHKAIHRQRIRAGSQSASKSLPQTSSV
ncbi:MAG: HAD-IC family P-type ATPase [Pseudomonadota bacterium]